MSICLTPPCEYHLIIDRQFLAALWPVQDKSSKAITGERLSLMYKTLSEKKKAAAAATSGGSRAIATKG